MGFVKAVKGFGQIMKYGNELPNVMNIHLEASGMYGYVIALWVRHGSTGHDICNRMHKILVAAMEG